MIQSEKFGCSFIFFYKNASLNRGRKIHSFNETLNFFIQSLENVYFRFFFIHFLAKTNKKDKGFFAVSAHLKFKKIKKIPKFEI